MPLTRAARPLVVCYHAVSATWPSALAVSPETLARQLGTFAAQGYVSLTFADAELRRRRGTLPRRALVITFDDGYASTMLAQPVLDRFGFRASVFVVTSFVDDHAPLSWPGVDGWAATAHEHELVSMDWTQLRALAGHGWEIGAHSVTHPRLTELGDAALREELAEPRAAINEQLGRCDTVAYPFGAADRRVARAAEAAGYLAGCTLPRTFEIDEPYLRPRAGLYERDVGWRLRAKTWSPAVELRGSRVAAALATRLEQAEVCARLRRATG